MSELVAKVTRSGGWWAVEVSDPPILTQARTLGEVEAMVRDAAALITGLPVDAFKVALERTPEQQAAAEYGDPNYRPEHWP